MRAGFRRLLQACPRTLTSFPTDNDKLCASVFAHGLWLRFVRSEDVVRWAERRIEEVDLAPEWLIDLSLMQETNVFYVIGQLKRIANDTDRVLICKAIYSLLPDIGGYSFKQAEAFAEMLYQITCDCVMADWSHELLKTSNWLAESFWMLREGYVAGTERELIDDVKRFVEVYRD